MKNYQRQIILQLNQLFQGDLLNLSILDQYFQNKKRSLLIDFKKLLTFKETRQDLNFIQEIVSFLEILVPYDSSFLFKYLTSNKKTEIGNVITLILIPNPKHRIMLQTMRMKLMLNLRNKTNILQESVLLITKLYKTLFQQIQSQQNINIEDNIIIKNKNLKSLLISLKKMMGVEKLKKPIKTKKSNINNYSVNLDIKFILQKAVLQIKQSPTYQKLHNLLQKSKHKNWLGPRLIKRIIQQNWNIDDIKLLILSLKKISIIKTDFRENFPIVKRKLKKIIQNLQNYIKLNGKIQEINQKIDLQNQQSQRPFQVEDIFINQDIDIYLQMSNYKSNTIFKELCQQSYNNIL